MQYEQLLAKVLIDGVQCKDRTGVGTRSLFGAQIRYDLTEGFPLITTKKVNFSAVVRELLWFLRGETNIKTLGCRIWDEWADGDGELGPVYGYQWRSWQTPAGAVDQIRKACDLLLSDPDSRRNIVSAWNVSDLPDMALQPCHVMFQLRQIGNFLSMHMFQRSADMALGVPFNIASYALLLELFAEFLRSHGRFVVAGDLVISFGDVHIYSNHVEGVRRQLKRDPRPFPTVNIIGDVSGLRDGCTLTPDDIRLLDYDPHPAIKFEVAI
jgi:thymidylate synthase